MGLTNRIGKFKRRHGVRGLALVIIALVAVIAGGGAVLAQFGGAGTKSASTVIALQRGLVGYWKLDGNAKDSTPFGRNGTLVASPTATADRKGAAGKALVFNGTSQYINLGTGSFPSSAYTKSAWVNISSCTNNNNILSGNGNTNDSHAFYFPSNSCKLSAGHNSAYTTVQDPAALSTSTWYFVVVTYDSSVASGTLKIYKNGTQVGSTATSVAAPTYNNGQLYIGSFAGGSLFTGSIDDVRLYNRALSLTEITALYNQYDPGVKSASGENNLLGWWKLDGNVKDAAPLANNGTLSGTTVPTLTTDRKGRTNSAYNFDGTISTGGYIQTTNRASYDAVVGTARTLSVWMKAAAQPHTGTLIYKDGSCIGWYIDMSGSGNISLHMTSGNSGCTGFTNETATTSGTNYGDNKWHLVTGVIDRPNNLLTLYVDGVSKATASVNNTTSGVTSVGMRIGTDFNDGFPFTGSLDDARVYGRALSAAEVIKLYKSYDSQIEIGGSGTTGSISLGKGLVGDWALNGNAKDFTPYGGDGTLAGTTLPSLAMDRKGRANSAYSFDGSTSVINVPSSTALNPVTAVTVNVWMNAASIPANGIVVGVVTKDISGILTNAPYGIELVGSGATNGFIVGRLTNAANTSIASNTAALIAPNTWYMITVTADVPNSAKVYINGVVRSTIGGFTDAGATTGSLRIGQQKITQGRFFNGSIDDVRVWNRALNQAEVTTLYNEYR